MHLPKLNTQAWVLEGQVDQPTRLAHAHWNIAFKQWQEMHKETARDHFQTLLLAVPEPFFQWASLVGWSA